DLPCLPPPPARPRPPATAIAGLLLLALLGGWLVAAPFVLGDQVRGARWTAATRADVATGAAVAVTAVLGLLSYLGAAVCWLARHGGRRA
ncbi:hypothetical protein KGA66_05805, partial [Actinocrinis puniceicyclus]